MSKTILLAALAAATTLGAQAQDIVGDWQGALKIGEAELHLVVHIAKVDNGGLKATMDSPDQGATGIPISSISLKDSKLIFTSDAVHGTYEGTLNAAGTEIQGTWTQRAPLPLVLKRGAATIAAPPRRPQNPVKPYPYREEDLTYENRQTGIKLAATLTVPQGKGPFPAVALITGSGAQDRDESLLGHKPFLVLADYLTRKGIAVLRTDDRGTAKSGGVFATATTADFATDTEAAIAYLKTRPEVYPKRIGLIGHSEGGVIAPMVAARNRDVAFIVMMAGTAVPGDEIIVAQVVANAEASGISQTVAAEAGVKQRRILNIVKQEKDEAVRRQKLRAELGAAVTDAQFEAAYKAFDSPWYRYTLTYDPGPALRQVTCPVLAINGEKDVQVPARLNLPVIRKALEAGGNKRSEVVELPGLNHLFQNAKTGAVSEYGQIEETMSPVALEKMASWILTQ